MFIMWTTMGGHEFYVVEFKDPPVLDLDRYICVPSTWVSQPFQDLTPGGSSTVLVKYPLEKPGATRARVKRFANYEEHWKMYIASVIHIFGNYNQAISYIKQLLKKSREGFSAFTFPDSQGSPSDSAKNKKTATEKKYNRSSLNKSNSSDGMEHEPCEHTCETVSEDIKTLKRDLLGFFDKFLPVVQRFEINIAQNSIVLEKILTIIVDKFNRPNTDETIPTALKDPTENAKKAADRENENITKTAQGESGAGDSIATISKDTTQTTGAMEQEVRCRRDENNTLSGVGITTLRDVETFDKAEKFATNIEKNSVVLEKILTILVDKFKCTNIDETISTGTRDATKINAKEREDGNLGTKTVQSNSGTGIHDCIAPTSKDTAPTAEAMEEEIETRSVNEENNNETIEDPKTNDVTMISDDENMTTRGAEKNTVSSTLGVGNTVARDAETVDDGSPQTVSAVSREDPTPGRQGVKRKLDVTDAHIPMKKRDGPRNPTLQNKQTAPEITLNNVTAQLVEPVPVNNQELAIPINFKTFIYDALKFSSLYKKKRRN